MRNIKNKNNVFNYQKFAANTKVYIYFVLVYVLPLDIIIARSTRIISF